mmetsp:Transcript_53682/g.165132  ORF Transcript_53682/g.165132 Transcript_53682/m.165132 type:complete len:389 (+) Transcript_53682:219-1385(+)
MVRCGGRPRRWSARRHHHSARPRSGSRRQRRRLWRGDALARCTSLTRQADHGSTPPLALAGRGAEVWVLVVARAAVELPVRRSDAAGAPPTRAFRGSLTLRRRRTERGRGFHQRGRRRERRRCDAQVRIVGVARRIVRVPAALHGAGGPGHKRRRALVDVLLWERRARNRMGAGRRRLRGRASAAEKVTEFARPLSCRLPAAHAPRPAERVHVTARTPEREGAGVEARAAVVEAVGGVLRPCEHPAHAAQRPKGFARLVARLAEALPALQHRNAALATANGADRRQRATRLRPAARCAGRGVAAAHGRGGAPAGRGRLGAAGLGGPAPTAHRGRGSAVAAAHRTTHHDVAGRCDDRRGLHAGLASRPGGSPRRVGGALRSRPRRLPGR